MFLKIGISPRQKDSYFLILWSTKEIIFILQFSCTGFEILMCMRKVAKTILKISQIAPPKLPWRFKHIFIKLLFRYCDLILKYVIYMESIFFVNVHTS